RFATVRQRTRFVLRMTLAFFSGLLMPLNTVFSGMVAKIYLEETDEIINNQRALDAVMSVVWLYVVSAAVLFILSAAQQYLLSSTTNELVDKLRREYLAAILRANATVLDQCSPGKLSSALNDDDFQQYRDDPRWNE
ncbi:hypothetical protein PMAYCL1PPCAC_16388, partial [Pristionchus mayeri]